VVVGEVKPGQDQGGLDLGDAAASEAADLAELAPRVEVHHVADGAGLGERRAVSTGERVEAVERQDGEQALVQAVRGDRPVVRNLAAGRGQQPLSNDLPPCLDQAQ
jgi:hypothetical protein